ncbi:hypothetical protein BRADI_1g15292v3 [Brachypodium distachyon]|uniref:Uncharacterized protein n=1 Tax=Brachypodium distachyon TaxID=15368 RepID=A0A2K2DJM4_BRADI|nr:hypothetical protein BRADI_1g15292v3 [Brachypodium distachyon]
MRPLTVPDSLYTCLLKAKYFPNGELADTVFIKNTSVCWQGIMHGLELLKKGLILRIVPSRASQSRLRHVAGLIDQDNRVWNEQVIRNMFHDFDTEEILKTRIPEQQMDDFIAWHHEKSGVFNVRSAYRLALNPFNLKLQLANTATISLAVQTNHHHRFKNIHETCTMCGMEPEDGFHAAAT